jgi:hypothetical protein
VFASFHMTLGPDSPGGRGAGSRSRRPLLIAVVAVGAVLLGACVSAPAPRPEPVQHGANKSVLSEGDIASCIETMARLASSDPAQQADIFFAIEREYTSAPTTANSLRYALALAIPDHPASNPTAAKQALQTLLAAPEKLTPEERGLATLALNDTEERLRLESDNSRLLATLDGRSRAQANSDRRTQAQVEENVRLRKSLEEAQQKLDAIRDIEKRSIIERSPSPPGSPPTVGSSRDALPEAQSSTAGR